MNSTKNSIKFSKTLTFSLSSNSKILKKEEEEENEAIEIKRYKYSKSSNFIKLPKNFVPVLRPKKKISQILTPLFLNPTHEANNSYEEMSYEGSSSSSDIEGENEKIEYKNNNNDFYEIKVYCNLDEKIDNNNDLNNKLLDEENCLNNVSKLRKTMKNIYNQSLHKKYLNSSEDVFRCNLKLNSDNDFAFNNNNNNNVNFNDDFNNYLKPKKHLSFCNTKNISILAVLKQSM
jgi:hypothetical protein